MLADASELGARARSSCYLVTWSCLQWLKGHLPSSRSRFGF